MKVLWLTNKVIPSVDAARGTQSATVNEGWISQMFKQLCQISDMSVTVVCGGDSINAEGKADEFNWYTFSENRREETFYSQRITDLLVRILSKEKPDIIHIWGSEYPHTLEMVDAAVETGLAERVVISLQGLISSYSLSYYSDLPWGVIVYKTLYDVLRSSGIRKSAEDFFHRGILEIKALSQVKHCIGRTDWDYHSVKAINPAIQYHKCNETLRECFYTGAWDDKQCERHSIFVSQATYPIKGFHFMLQALPTLLKAYPDTHVYVSGKDLTSTRRLMDRMKLSSYGQYLGRLIKENHLQEHVTFLGRLDAEQMKQQYLKANVFVSCSSIENSPNSVGEAMLLGTPVVSSDVGGVRSILKAPEEGLTYPWNSADALANAVIRVFDAPEEAMSRAHRARQHALITHDAETNFNDLLRIYEEIYCN